MNALPWLFLSPSCTTQAWTVGSKESLEICPGSSWTSWRELRDGGTTVSPATVSFLLIKNRKYPRVERICLIRTTNILRTNAKLAGTEAALFQVWNRNKKFQNKGQVNLIPYDILTCKTSERKLVIFLSTATWLLSLQPSVAPDRKASLLKWVSTHTDKSWV